MMSDYKSSTAHRNVNIDCYECIQYIFDSMHASGNTNSEMRELQDILKDDDLSLSEKQ